MDRALIFYKKWYLDSQALHEKMFSCNHHKENINGNHVAIHNIPTIMAEKKNMENIKCWWSCEQMELFDIHGGCVSWHDQFGNLFGIIY